MFVHAVLFEVQPEEVLIYREDSKMWANFAKRADGFVAYSTMERVGYKNQYVSVYGWKSKQNHDHFMERFHDSLVSKSKAKVKVLGYYGLSAIDKVR